MALIVAAGTPEFTLGFALSGVNEIIELNPDIFSSLKEIKKRGDIAIVILEESSLDKLESHERFEIESSIEPVFVPVSVKAEQETLRRLIKKSIGIDVWK